MNLKRFMWFTALLVIGGLWSQPAQASHFRYGTLNWQPTGIPGEVRINFKIAFRRNDPAYGSFASADGFAVTGDVITDNVGMSILQFGDGDETDILKFKVTSYSVSENWIVADMIDPSSGEIGLKHTYFGSGPFTVLAPNCCRVSRLNNRAGLDYYLETDVYPTTGNRSPVATQVPIVVAVEAGSTATFPVPAVDSDGDVLQWRFSSDFEAIGFGNMTPPPNTNPPNTPDPSEGAPPNMSINPNTGIATWNTLGLDTGSYWTVQFLVEDWTTHPSQGGTLKGKVPVDFLLRILPKQGNIPECVMTPSGDEVVTVGTPVSFTLQATDLDPGDILSITASGLPSGSTMTPALPLSGPSGTTSVFDWTPGFDDIGSYVVLFSITDQRGHQHLCYKKITVIVGSQNHPPILSINPAGPLTVTALNPVSFAVTGTDPDPNDILTLDVVSGMPSGAAMTPVLPTSGPASGVSSVFNWTPTSAQAGTHVIEYRVTDQSGSSATKSITINVLAQLPPVITITPPGPLSVQHNSVVGFVVKGTDPNTGDTVTLNVVSGMPSGATMTPVLPTSGPASGVTSNFTWTPNLLQLGTYVITYSATDQVGNQATRSITINVVPGPNAPPILTIAPAGPLSIIIGQSVTFNVTGTDTDALDQVTLAAPNGLPSGSTMAPALPTTGPTGVSSVFNWTPPQVGTTVIHYTATDIIGAQDADSIVIVVNPRANLPPVADAGPDQTLPCKPADGASVRLNGSGSSDPDGDPLTYTWNGPFGTRTGVIVTVGMPVGVHTVVLTVDDGISGTDADTMIVTIIADTTPPVITLNGDNPMTIECPVSYDEPGAVVTDDCDATPTLTITGTVNNCVPGEYIVTYTARDRFGNQTVATRTVRVVDTTAPVIAVHSDPHILSPADHLYRTINIASCIVSITDACAGLIDVSQLRIIKVSSDEPEDVECDNTCPPLVENLTAGQHTIIGNVTIWNDATTLFVQYNVTSSGWTLGKTHVNVSQDAIVVRGKTYTPSSVRPPPGQYTTQITHNPSVTTYTYSFPLSQWTSGTIYVLTHAEALRSGGGETAYGGNNGNTGSGWWFYSVFEVCEGGSGGSGGSGNHDDDDDGNGGGGYSNHDDDDDGNGGNNGCPVHGGNKSKGNNGVGNGFDPQPPGNPSVNDGHGTGPGNPGNKNKKNGAGKSNVVLVGFNNSSSKNDSKSDDKYSNDSKSSKNDSKSSSKSDDDDDSGKNSKSSSKSDDKYSNNSGKNNNNHGGSNGGHDDDDDGNGGSNGGHDDDDDGNGGSNGGHDDDDDGNGGGCACTCNDPDGDTLNDIVIAPDGKSVQLRAERRSDGNGRVYTITMEVTDPSGNVATAECKVWVPNGGTVAIDDGPGAGYTVYSGQAPVANNGGSNYGSQANKTGAKLSLNKEAEKPASKPAAEEIEEVVAVAPALPTAFALKPNYPNPFNPSTTIAYDIPQQAHVSVEVYNMLGQMVVRLVDEYKTPGSYTVTWNGNNQHGLGVASGIYLYRIVTSSGYTQSRRMTLLK